MDCRGARASGSLGLWHRERGRPGPCRGPGPRSDRRAVRARVGAPDRHSYLCCCRMSRWPSSKGPLRSCELVGTSSAGPARIDPLRGRVDQTPCLHSMIEMRLARRCPLGRGNTRDLPRKAYGAGVGHEQYFRRRWPIRAKAAVRHSSRWRIARAAELNQK